MSASSSDSSALPNTGVQSDIQVINFATTGCLAFWIAIGLPNNEWRAGGTCVRVAHSDAINGKNSLRRPKARCGSFSLIDAEIS